jgi:hypothetical protein
VVAGGKDPDDVGAEIVTGAVVLVAGIAQADDQQVSGFARAFALQVG